MNSMYMNAQMKLMESEYGIKMSYYENNNNRNNNIDNLDEEENEEEPIIDIRKKKKKFSKEKKEEETEEKNIIQINVKNSIKKSNNININNENINSSVKVEDDFYSLDINNTSGRNIKEGEKEENS